MVRNYPEHFDQTNGNSVAWCPVARECRANEEWHPQGSLGWHSRGPSGPHVFRVQQEHGQGLGINNETLCKIGELLPSFEIMITYSD